LVLKICREFDDVTSAGKLFHVRAAATRNARSLTVDSRVDCTSNAEIDDDRRRCRHVSPLLLMAEHGGTVSRRTANKKLTKLY